MRSNPFRWPVRWRRRSGEGEPLDSVTFWSMAEFTASVPKDLFAYCPRGFWDDASWFGRSFRQSWEPVEEISRPDMHALRHYVDPMRQCLAETIPMPTRKQRRTAFADDGNEVDIDRLALGKPCFRNLQRTRKPGVESVGLVVDTTIGGGVKGADLYWRGAAAIALTDALESRGYAVDVWAVTRAFSANRHIAKAAVIAVRLKRGGEPMEAAGLVNALSWMPRVILYPLASTAPVLRDSILAGKSLETRTWLPRDWWMLDELNLPTRSYVLYGFDSGAKSRRAMRSILDDIERDANVGV